MSHSWLPNRFHSTCLTTTNFTVLTTNKRNQYVLCVYKIESLHPVPSQFLRPGFSIHSMFTLSLFKSYTESKKKGNGIEDIQGVIHIWSGINKDQRATSGVGILIKIKFRRNIKSWEAVNERIIKLNITLYGRAFL